ncbi:MAG TPA: porin, partial [Chitinophagaceae bacterium]|nr:porin [Chitinophagaceae bacterium]
ADAQLSINWKGGLTTLRAEYIGGTQGGTPTGSATPRTLPTENSYSRHFNGAYFYWVQNILNSKHNVVIKYDWYDPNTKVTEDQIGVSKNNLTAADIKFSTLGLGYYYNLDENWRFLLYADLVKNKATSLSGYTKDLKDNVLTLRVQYRFF